MEEEYARDPFGERSAEALTQEVKHDVGLRERSSRRDDRPVDAKNAIAFDFGIRRDAGQLRREPLRRRGAPSYQ